MAFWKKSEDPWDWDPSKKRPAPRPAEPKEPQANPLDSLKQWNEDRKAKAKEREEAKRLPPEKCPWCGKDMEQGYLIGGRGIYWYSGIPTTGALAKVGWLGPKLDDAFRVDDEGNFLTSPYRTAWRCKECKKVVFHMPEEDIWSMDRYRYDGPQEPQETQEEETSEE